MPDVNALHLSLTDFSNASRVIKETRSLTAAGVFDHIYIVALHRSGLGLAERESISDQVTLHRLVLSSRRLGVSLFAYALMYLEFAFTVGRLFRGRQIRCVNAHSLAILPVAWLLARWWSAKLVFDAHELETETNGLKGRRQRVSRWLERTLIHRCDLIIVVGESIADWYADAYQMERPVVVFNAPALQYYPDSSRLREQLELDPGQRILLYQGLLTTGRGVEVALEYFANRKSSDLVMVFMGYGPLWELVRQASSNCSLIHGVPAVPPDEVLQYTASADYGIAFGGNVCLSYDLSMPNKLFEYLMAGLPVIVSPLQEMARFVEQHACGVVAEGFDADSLDQSIDKLLSQDRETLSAAARKAAQENAWERQADKLEMAYLQADIGKATLN